MMRKRWGAAASILSIEIFSSSAYLRKGCMKVRPEAADTGQAVQILNQRQRSMCSSLCSTNCYTCAKE